METKLVQQNKQVLRHSLLCFKNLSGVLYVAAHPDDENTELLAYLARGRGCRTAYLSLTRGDGGQNVRGSDLGTKLGVARTQELLSARKLDGARQYFSRAIDFGFSKSHIETLKTWQEREILKDTVRVIRLFRPDVIITRFSTEPGGTHGHHTASALVALEAFKIAGRRDAFPELGLPPWQPRRIFWNTSIWQKEKIQDHATLLTMNIGGKDPLSEQTIQDIAEQSRAMHKTQGFDTFKFPGSDNKVREASFQLLAGDSVRTDILEDIVQDWSRYPGGKEINDSVDKVIAALDNTNENQLPLYCLNELFRIKSILEKIPADPVTEEKRVDLSKIILECTGLSATGTVQRAEALPGESLLVACEVTHYPGLIANIPIRWDSISFPVLGKTEEIDANLSAATFTKHDTTITIPSTMQLTQPYWLRKPGTNGLFSVEDENLLRFAENPAEMPVKFSFSINGETLTTESDLTYRNKRAASKPEFEKLAIVPPISMSFDSDITLAKPGEQKNIELKVIATRENIQAEVSLLAPPGWTVKPESQHLKFVKSNHLKKLTFSLNAPPYESRGVIQANAKVGDEVWKTDRQEIVYHHIPRQILQPPAVSMAVSTDVKILAKRIGYLPGAGDDIPKCLRQIGCIVLELKDSSQVSEDYLNGFDAIVVGVRALNVRKDISAYMPHLLSYVKHGGTLLIQYNRDQNLLCDSFAPYPIELSNDRITNEQANVDILVQDSSILNIPNRITPKDFDGWVQERGLYFPSKWDKHYTALLSMKDADEAPTKGSVLVAKFGKGYYVYTGLSFFRQLPAAVPGAYRLFANLLSPSKQ